MRKSICKYMQHILPVLVAAVILLSNFTVVSAASNQNFPSSNLHIQSYIPEPYGKYNGLQTYKVDCPVSGYFFSINEFNLYQDSSTYYTIRGSSSFDMQLGPRYVSSMGNKQFWGYNFNIGLFDNGYLLDLTGLDSQCKVLLNFDFNYTLVSGSVSYYVFPSLDSINLSYYDIYGNFLSTQSYEGMSAFYNDNLVSVEGSFPLNLPEGAKYCSIGANINDLGFASDQWCTFNISITDLEVLIARPEKIIAQDYKNIATSEVTSGLYKNWLIENDSYLGSSSLTSNDPDLPQAPGTAFNSISFNAKASSDYKYKFRFRMFYPYRFLSLDNLPVGTNIGINSSFHIHSNSTWFFPYAELLISYYDSNFQYIDADQRWQPGRDYPRIDNDTGGILATNFTLSYPSNAKYLSVSIILQSFYVFGTDNSVPVSVTVDPFEFWVQEFIGDIKFPTGDNLGSVGDDLELNHPSIDDIKTQISQLVDMNAFLAFSNVLALFWQSSTLHLLLVAVSGLVLVSWVLFGQK